MTTGTPSHIRRNVLFTLARAENQNSGRRTVCPNTLKSRLLTIFPKETIIIIAKEKHQNGGYHYHAGLMTYMSKHGLEEKLRKAFPEWQGHSLHVCFKKGWSPICSYISLEDEDFLAYGIKRTEVFALAFRFRKHLTRKSPPVINEPDKKEKQKGSLKSPPKPKGMGRKFQASKVKKRVYWNYWLKRALLFHFIGFLFVCLYEILAPVRKRLSSFLFPIPENPPSLLSKFQDWCFPAPPPKLAPWELFLSHFFEPTGLSFYDVMITIL